MGWAGGLLRLSPSQLLIGASALTSGFQAPCLLSPHPSPCQGPALATLLARLPRASAPPTPQSWGRTWALEPFWTRLRSSSRSSPLLLGSLGFTAEAEQALPLKEPCSQQRTSAPSGSTTGPGHLGLLPCHTNPLRPWARRTAVSCLRPSSHSADTLRPSASPAPGPASACPLPRGFWIHCSAATGLMPQSPNFTHVLKEAFAVATLI